MKAVTASGSGSFSATSRWRSTEGERAPSETECAGGSGLALARNTARADEALAWALDEVEKAATGKDATIMLVSKPASQLARQLVFMIPPLLMMLRD
jgi:hypothetical protein